MRMLAEQFRRMDLEDGEEIDDLKNAGSVNDKHHDEPPAVSALTSVPQAEALPKNTPDKENE